MIRSLTVENLALIAQAELPLGTGLTAIAGETGAGKSLLIDSLELALGGRADSCFVRRGARAASVNLVVDVADNPPALAVCEELGIEVDEGEVLIRRDISAEGRSTVRINGRPATVGMLRSLAPTLAGLHTQSESLSLSDQSTQLDLLDAWIGEPAGQLVAEVAAQLHKVESIRSRLRVLHCTERERAQKLDLLTFQVSEILEAEVRPGECEEIKVALSRLVNAQRLSDTFNTLIESLAESDGSAAERISGTVREISHAAALDPSLAPILELAETADSALSEALSCMRRYAAALDFDPASAESAAGRLDLLNRLKRKYGETEEEVLEFLARAKSELDGLLEDGADAESLQSELTVQTKELQSLADSLSFLRQQRAKGFADSIQGHIRELAIPEAAFAVNFQKGDIGPAGQDLVEFGFSANRGEPRMPLHKVASGGELSRVMLAIKVSCAGIHGTQSLVFDEVDAGLSGRAAAATARKLQELAKTNQVVVVSHLPQVAAAADTLVEISKLATSTGTHTGLRILAPEERPQAIARMLAGEQVGASAIANAEELIADARKVGSTLVLTG